MASDESHGRMSHMADNIIFLDIAGERADRGTDAPQSRKARGIAHDLQSRELRIDVRGLRIDPGRRMTSSVRIEDDGLQQIRKLTEVSRALTYAASLDEVLQLTVDRAVDLLAAEKSLLMVANDDGLLALRASHGVDAALVERFHEPLSETLIARLAGASRRAAGALPRGPARRGRSDHGNPRSSIRPATSTAAERGRMALVGPRRSGRRRAGKDAPRRDR